MHPIVEQIPDISLIRRQLSFNARERELLTKLLKLAERKLSIDTLNRQANEQPSQRGAER
jgi:hypothetical protein